MQSTPTHAPLSQEQLATYDRDGYIVVRGLYAGEEMARWKQVILSELEHEEKYDLASGIRAWRVNEFPADLIDAMSDQQVTPILRQLIGSNVEFLSAKAVFKDAATSFPSPWHQDWFYWYGTHKLSVWIALDDADESNGCLKVIPGSHRRVFNKQVIEGENLFVNRIKDEDVADLPVVSAECKRGDAVFFHDLLVHASHTNTSGSDRWSFISTYRDGMQQDDAKAWPCSLVVCGESVNAQAQMRG